MIRSYQAVSMIRAKRGITASNESPNRPCKWPKKVNETEKKSENVTNLRENL